MSLLYIPLYLTLVFHRMGGEHQTSFHVAISDTATQVSLVSWPPEAQKRRLLLGLAAWVGPGNPISGQDAFVFFGCQQSIIGCLC